MFNIYIYIIAYFQRLNFIYKTKVKFNIYLFKKKKLMRHYLFIYLFIIYLFIYILLDVCHGNNF